MYIRLYCIYLYQTGFELNGIKNNNLLLNNMNKKGISVCEPSANMKGLFLKVANQLIYRTETKVRELKYYRMNSFWRRMSRF